MAGKIEIRQAPSGNLTAWHNGELLPFAVKWENEYGSAYTRLGLTGGVRSGSVVLGAPLTSEADLEALRNGPGWMKHYAEPLSE